MPTSDVADVPGGAEKVVTSVRLRRPDDWHVHLRDGAMLKSVVNYTARQFARAIVMPNLSPPITTAAAAKAYRERIVAALEPGLVFVPLMTCYLTDTIDASEVERGFAEGVFTACKLYPAHATTNSAHGVTDIRNIHSVLEVMQRIGMPLLLHAADRHAPAAAWRGHGQRCRYFRPGGRLLRTHTCKADCRLSGPQGGF